MHNVSLTNYCQNWKIKKYKMGRTNSKHARCQKNKQSFVQKTQKEVTIWNQRDIKIIFKWFWRDQILLALHTGQ